MIERTIQQVTEAEQEIYDDLVEAEIEGLDRIDNSEHGNTIFNEFSLMGSDNQRIENYEIVRRVAEAKGDSDVLTAEKSLRSLLQARAALLDLKQRIQ